MMERLASWNSAGALSQKRGGTYRLPRKAQGSRAVLIAGRDPERVQKRFGGVPGQQGACYTRASKASPSHRSMSGTRRGQCCLPQGCRWRSVGPVRQSWTDRSRRRPCAPSTGSIPWSLAPWCCLPASWSRPGCCPRWSFPRNAGSWRASSSGGWGGCSGSGRRSPGKRVERGGLGADRQEFREISPSRMRFKAPHIYRPVQGRGRGAFAGGPDAEIAVRTTGLLTAGRNRGSHSKGKIH